MEAKMNKDVMKPDDHEPDYRKAMIYHSDRADAYMAERDAALSDVATLRARLARMEGAIDRWAEHDGEHGYDVVVRELIASRAALTDGGSNG
jgi:hypothetical protein